MDSEKTSPGKKRGSECNSVWPCLQHVPAKAPINARDAPASLVTITKTEIGRLLKKNDLLLDGVGISRNHAQIYRKDDEWFYKANISNKDSINGCVLRQLDEKPLKDNDIIRISFDEYFTYKFILDDKKKTKYDDDVGKILAQGKYVVDGLCELRENLQINLKIQSEEKMKIQENLQKKLHNKQSLLSMLSDVQNEIQILRSEDEEKHKLIMATEKRIEGLNSEISKKYEEIDNQVKKAQTDAQKSLEIEKQILEEKFEKSRQEIEGWRSSDENPSKRRETATLTPRTESSNETWLNVKQEKETDH